MQLFLLPLTALAVGYAAAFPSDGVVSHLLQKRQGVPSSMIAMANRMMNPNGGKVTAPYGAAAARVELDSRTKVPGSKTIKLRHGPYKVPNMKSKNFLGEGGSLWNYGDLEVQKPCDMCTIVGMNAGLEYPDGSNANINTGLWLHHMVLVNSGPGRTDATCDFLPVSGPHLIAGAFPRSSERLFSSGNERTVINFPGWGQDKVGYKLKTADKFSMIVDLMNENMQDKVVYLTMTYDILPGHPTDYSDVKPVWFDVAQCMTSEWTPPYQGGKYTVPSMKWKANFNGEVLNAIGHLHDGGQKVVLDVDGRKVCSSEASYGTKPEFVQKTAMGHAHGATEHISEMTVCVHKDMGIQRLEKGQVWRLKAEYDYGKNKGNLHENGKQDNVMGIALMYVKLDK